MSNTIVGICLCYQNFKNKSMQRTAQNATNAQKIHMRYRYGYRYGQRYVPHLPAARNYNKIYQTVSVLSSCCRPLCLVFGNTLLRHKIPNNHPGWLSSTPYHPEHTRPPDPHQKVISELCRPDPSYTQSIFLENHNMRAAFFIFPLCWKRKLQLFIICFVG